MMNIALLSFDANGMRRVWRVLKILKYGLMWATVWQFCQWQCNRYFTSELPKNGHIPTMWKISNFEAISFSKMYEQQSLKWIFTMSGANLFFDLNWNLVEKVC